jgi:hypothetical protein
MKLNGKVMVAVAMLAASVAAVGCTTADASVGLVAPEETPATAPVVTDVAGGSAKANPGVEKDALSFRFYAPFAPPAARVEVIGVAPSARHFWAPGYYRWTGRQYVWIAGRWELRRPGVVYVAPHWVREYGRYVYVPGRWVRTV